MSKWWIWIGGIGLALIAFGSGVVLYATTQSKSLAPRTVTSSSGQSDSIPLSSSQQPKNSELSVLPANGSTSQVMGSQSQQRADQQTESADSLLDPKHFNEFEKYKDGKEVMLAELQVGAGAAVDAGKTVTVHYRGWLTDGTLFDENMDSIAKPFSFVLGSGTTIPGWELGVVGMKVGGERLIVVPPALGYGATGKEPIPPNAVLVFYVKVLDAR